MSTGGWLLLRASSRKHHTGVSFAVDDSCFGNCHLRWSRPCHGRLQLVGFRVVRPTQLYMPSISPIMKNKDKKITYWAKCMHEGCTRMKTKWTTISEITTHKEQYMFVTQVSWTRGGDQQIETQILEKLSRDLINYFTSVFYIVQMKKKTA